MNYLWGGMIIVGIVYGTLTGNIEQVGDAALSSAKEAVTLCITMTGVMSLWVGFMEIAKDSGLIGVLSRKIRPFVSFLFPGIPKGHEACEHITTNMIANLLGLGWAATPAGLKAMEALADLEEERRNRSISFRDKTAEKKRRFLPVPKGVASNEMCTFLIINISSLQLIPVNIIAYRSQYGSVNPTAIVGPAIVATLISTLAGIIFVKIMDHKK